MPRLARLVRTVRAACCALALGAGAATAAPSMAALARIETAESLGRAKPEAALTQLELLGKLAAGDAETLLETYTVQGLVVGTATRGDAAERIAAQLDALGGDATLKLRAAAAAQLVRANAASRGGQDFSRADRLLRDAIASLPLALSPRERFRYVFVHAYVLDRLGRPPEAVRLGHEALALADHDATPWRQSEARSQLAYSYSTARQHERAKVLAQEAITAAGGDDVALGRAENMLGIALDAFGDRAGEQRAFETALEHARKAGAKGDEARYRANLADIFLQTGDFRTALAHAERVLPLAREIGDPNSEMVAVANAGLAHISLGHLELGKKLVAEAIAIDEKRGATASLSETWKELGKYLEKAGDLQAAVAAYHKHRAMATTILRDDQQKAIVAMQEQYDADQRAKALELLNREQQVKGEQLHRRDLQQQLAWLLAAVFVLGIAAVALLYRRVRQNNRLLTSSNEILKVQSERDPLTGLANRRHFQAVMRQRASDGTLAGTVYLIDIDHFKQINDAHGHGAGDAVLVEVARRLHAALREDDLIVRWGGEEFLVVVDGLAPAGVDALAQRMLKALDETPVDAGDARRIGVSASIGYATFPIGPKSLKPTWERAINLVDTAMYLAKAHGRNRAYGVRLLQAGDDAALESITERLEEAWREGQVELTLLQGRTAPHLQVAA